MDGNAGGYKNGGAIGAGVVPAGAAPSAIDWKPMPAIGEVAALLTAAAADSCWE